MESVRVLPGDVTEPQAVLSRVKSVRIIPGGVAEPQAALNKIKIIDNGEDLVDIRIRCPLVVFPTDAGIPEGMTPFLRETAAAMLDEASRRLPKDFHFYALSAYRGLERQEEIWWSHYNRYKQLHPTWPESSLRRATNKYVAPYDNPAPPGHSTGAAIDVVLQRSDGSFVDLLPECGKDTHGLQKNAQYLVDDATLPEDLTDWTLGSTWSTKIDPTTKEFRMILVETMLSVGFSNCRDEYWHYSYGDSGWAVRVGQTECCYGAIDPPY